MISEKQRKNGEDKFDYHEKTVQMNKVLIRSPETSGFFRCYHYGMTLPLRSSFFTLILSILLNSKLVGLCLSSLEQGFLVFKEYR